MWKILTKKTTLRKFWNLAHSKYSSWGMCDFYMTSSVPSLWCHTCICKTLHLISMKNFEGHLGIKWSRENNWWRHRSRDSGIILFFLTFKNLLLWSGWTNRGKTLQVWLPIHEEQQGHTYDVIGHMVWQPCWIYPKTDKKKIRHSKEVLASVCNLCLLFFLFSSVSSPWVGTFHCNSELVETCFCHLEVNSKLCAPYIDSY